MKDIKKELILDAIETILIDAEISMVGKSNANTYGLVCLSILVENAQKISGADLLSSLRALSKELEGKHTAFFKLVFGDTYVQKEIKHLLSDPLMTGNRIGEVQNTPEINQKPKSGFVFNGWERQKVPGAEFETPIPSRRLSY